MKPLVLLLEDDPAIAGTVAYALEREGLDVVHVLLSRPPTQRRDAGCRRWPCWRGLRGPAARLRPV